MIAYALFILLLFFLKAGSEFALIVLAYVAVKALKKYLPPTDSFVTRFKRALKAF